MKIIALISCLSLTCLPSDKSDRLPDVNRDNATNTNNITINNKLLLTPKRAHPIHAGPKHPKVEEAHEIARRRQEDDDFITCCCFFKMKKLPLH